MKLPRHGGTLFNPCTQEAETGRSLSLRTDCSTQCDSVSRKQTKKQIGKERLGEVCRVARSENWSTPVSGQQCELNYTPNGQGQTLS